MTHPANSPLALVRRFAEELRREEISQKEFLERLDLFERDLGSWHSRLEALGAQNAGQSPDLLDPKESSQALALGCEGLREWARGRDAETLRQALEQIGKASELIAGLLESTGQSI